MSDEKLPHGWIMAECEVCHKRWRVQKSLATRTCSKKCGAKINPSSCKDESKWTTVTCDTCGKQFERRKIHVQGHCFCSRKCLSKGFAALHQTHNVKSNVGKGYNHGHYVTVNGRKIKYDSTYELRRMHEYDYLLDDLESWDRCSDVIPWEDSKGKTRHYNPDFLLVYRDGHNVVEEVKGRVTDDDVRKMAAARDWYEGKNVTYRMFCIGDFRDEPQVMTKVYTNDYGVFSRPTLEYVFMRMAYALAERSTCLRKKVGVVLTDPEMQHAYCLGYNGSERGGSNQCESLEPGKCNCIHAEMNALTKNNANITGATCFVTTSPCPVCAKLLVNRGISRVIYGEAYRNSRGIQILLDHGIEVIKYDKLVESFGDTL